MATPHVSGGAALLRGARPQWSLVRDPAATPFAMGAGFINPGVDVFYALTHDRVRSL
jgi:subtilisin family serine protease